MTDSKIRKSLSVDLYILLVKKVDEYRVSESEFTNRIIDTNSPKTTEISFLETSSDICIGSCFHKSVFCSSEYISIHHSESFRTSEKIIMSFLGHKTTFYTYHIWVIS